MNLEDLFLPPHKITAEPWQLASMITNDLKENSIALIFCSDYRGINEGEAEMVDFRNLRKELYKLSKLDFEMPVCDLGDLVSGKNQEDTHYVLDEILTMCRKKNAIPVVIGGSNELAYVLFSSLNATHQNITYTQISNLVTLTNEGENLNESNFLSKILSSKNFSLKNYHHLGYQKHLNANDSVKLMREVDFDVIRLAEMMGSTDSTEPFFRQADLVTVNCDAVESIGDGFSVNPQVNGLNRREICAYMKEIGLSQNLKSAGIFNANIKSRNQLNHQLLAQMIWHLIEGINIQRSHPAERAFETFWVMIGEEKFAFHRETFSDLWYFGTEENNEKLKPCSPNDYDAAKKGFINPRLLKF
ncbi:arginase family protein [Kaistella polysaccharea]|uniref:arginase family protein n=1 Tax=Kaistella polysaccharea TaxID=2878534 RepID=UPI001CF24B7A|nr:arginase family protein [Kaistella polysaccharea]